MLVHRVRLKVYLCTFHGLGLWAHAVRCGFYTTESVVLQQSRTPHTIRYDFLSRSSRKMQARGLGSVTLAQENPLWLSWHDTAWIAVLNPSNVMDYFMEKSNPFYDRTCNNEIVKMQRQSFEHLKYVPNSVYVRLKANFNLCLCCSNMVGVEYILLHVQDPILYVVRKQHRHTPAEATPIADYYIIAGTIYQAPDLANVFNSRIVRSCLFQFAPNGKS